MPRRLVLSFLGVAVVIAVLFLTPRIKPKDIPPPPWCGDLQKVVAASPGFETFKGAKVYGDPNTGSEAYASSFQIGGQTSCQVWNYANAAPAYTCTSPERKNCDQAHEEYDIVAVGVAACLRDGWTYVTSDKVSPSMRSVSRAIRADKVAVEIGHVYSQKHNTCYTSLIISKD